MSPENAYNPIPSPDGKSIAYVRTGWSRPGGSGGFGRSNLVSEVMVMDNNGNPLTTAPLADTFLADWTADGKALICYRDWSYSLINVNGTTSLHGLLGNGTERVFYASTIGAMGWSRMGKGFNTVLETHDHMIAEHAGWLGDIVVPSPDGRYLAVFTEEPGKHLWVYDLQAASWSDLGALTIHPDSNWDYIKPSWNPWFSDSSHLAYFSGSALVISEPDGKAKRTFPIHGQAGLAAASPDGKSIAYATYDPRPMATRPDLTFWGGTILWILRIDEGAEGRAVTDKNPATTYDVKWMGNDALVFDRFEDTPFHEHGRIWRVSTTPPPGR